LLSSAVPDLAALPVSFTSNPDFFSANFIDQAQL